MDHFVLKGANLFYVWTGQLYRPTRDVEMLHFGPTHPKLLAEIIHSCVTAAVAEDDGITFDTDTIDAQVIREEELYSGVRVALKAYLGNAKIALRLDVESGDAVTPAAELIDYPSLLDMPTARLRAYRFETAIAEKCEAMVKLGMFNTRLKDFYDVFVLARDRSFDGVILTGVVRDTSVRRGTPLPEQAPVAWTSEFGENAQKRSPWSAFLKKYALEAPDLSGVIGLMSTFLMPICDAARGGTGSPAQWERGAWTVVMSEEG